MSDYCLYCGKPLKRKQRMGVWKHFCNASCLHKKYKELEEEAKKILDEIKEAKKLGETRHEK